MSVSEQMPLADVKNRLSEVVDRLEREHGRVVITKHGHPAAVVISVDDLESLEETLDIMDSAGLLADIRESLAELSTTDAYQIRDLTITVGGDVAFCHSLIQLGGALWFRSTIVLRKIGGEWLITHEHNSTPFYMDGSDRAALDLHP